MRYHPPPSLSPDLDGARRGVSGQKLLLKTVTALYSFPMALQPCAAFLAHAFPLVPSTHTLLSAVCYQIMRENYSQQELPEFQQDDSLFSTTSYLAVKQDKCCSSCRKKYISARLHVTTLPHLSSVFLAFAIRQSTQVLWPKPVFIDIQQPC